MTTRTRMAEAQEELLIPAEHLHFFPSRYHFYVVKNGMSSSVYVPPVLAEHLQLQNGDAVMLVLAKKSDWERLEAEAVKVDV